MNAHFLKLNISFLFLIAILFAPSMALADGEDFDEVTYVFRSSISEVPADIQDCFYMVDIPFVTTDAGNYDLYSYQSKKTSGVILNGAIKRIGHILTCVDTSGVGPDNFLDFMPAYFKVTLDGMELRALGQGRLLSLDVPEPFLGLSTWAVEIIEGPPEVIGGWLVANAITNLFGIPGYVNGSFVSIRLFTLADSNDD
jgi:hypothetical protein